MGRPKKQEKRVCNSHTFSIRPKQNQACYYQQAITVKFCCNSYCQGSSSAKNGRSCYQGPIFNKDKNFSTPSFILSSDRYSYMQNANKGKPENDKKFINYNDQKSELFEPKPNSKNMYCSVCKERYEDYRDHIRSEKHKKKIRTHNFSNYIFEIQAKYKETRKEKLKGREKDIAQTNDEIDGVIVIASGDEEINYQNQYESRPRKRVKLDNNPYKFYPQQPPRTFPTLPGHASIMNNEFFPSQFFYPNHVPNLQFPYQHYAPPQQNYMNPFIPCQMSFGQFLPQGYFNGMMGNYHQGMPQVYPQYPYNTTDATFQREPELMGIKQNIIIVDDDRE